MTGNLTVPSLNGGQLAGFRNILINGDLKVNQRGVAIAAAAVGAYGPDRWKKVDASSMTQIVEDLNFVPSATYTLSWKGGTPQQLIAPATGHWTLPSIPIAATEVQLERGTVATPFERRLFGAELTMCQRYYQQFGFQSNYVANAVGASSAVNPLTFLWPVWLRVNPTVIFTASGGINAVLAAPIAVTAGFSQSVTSGASGGLVYFTYSLTSASAEL